jgi:predicted N-acetyltransferase YhbS
MKLVRWRRFTWELAKLPPLDGTLPDHYHLRAAARDEEKAVHGVIFSAFSLDTSWSDALQHFRESLEAQIEAAFEHESVPGLVICHGQRIIAASALTTGVDAENHLLSGPCVLMEYRNRGLGTALLHYSLKQLQNNGLEQACGISKENVVASKFIYRKFGSVSEPYDFEPVLATG